MKHRILKFEDLRSLCMAKLARRFCYEDLPVGIQSELFSLKAVSSQITRLSLQSKIMEIPALRNTKSAQTFLVKIPTLWNSLNEECRNSKTKNQLNNAMKKEIFKKYNEVPECKIKDCFCCK